MTGSDIFISYARVDQEFARRFAEAFVREGFNVWWDAALHSGQTFDEIIERELRAARAVVVLWSPRSVASRWVRAEATLADRSGTLAPAIIEPCDRPIIFELTHTVDLCHWDGDLTDPSWRVYVQDLQRLIGKDGSGSGDAAPLDPSRVVARAGPSPAPAAAQEFNKALAGGNVESLLSAISSLQETMRKQGGQGGGTAKAPPQPDVQDEEEATQFYTAADQFGLGDDSEIHCLELTVGDDTPMQRFPIGPLGVKIGRSGPVDIVLPDSKVSRSHCQVDLKDGLIFVTDLNSTNGTFVDGERVEGSAILPVGGALRCGHCVMQHEVLTREELEKA